MLQVVAEAGVDLHNSNVGREVSGRKSENPISGVDRSTNSVAELELSAINDVRRSANANTLENEFINKIAQLDVGSLLNAGTPGQGASQGQGQQQGQTQAQPQGQTQGLRPAGPSDINTSNIAGDLANQLAPGPGVNSQRPASNDLAGDLANQIAGGGAAPIGKGQGQVAAAQSGGAGAAVVEVKSTIIQEANGQQIQTLAIEQQGQGQQPAAAPAPTEASAMTAPQAPAAPTEAKPTEAKPTEAKPTEAKPTEAKPTEAPAEMPAPAETQSKPTAAEAAPKPETQPAQPPAEGMSAMVCKIL